MAEVTTWRRVSPCVVLLVVLAICQYYVFVLNGPFLGFLKDKVSSLSPPLKNIDESFKKSEGPVHVLLLSYARTGSSFVGDLLQSYPKAFYYFEPLHFLGETVINTTFPEARHLFYQLFKCKVTKVPGFLNWQQTHPNYMKLRRNPKFWKDCAKTKSCYNSTYMDNYCANNSAVIIKTIRITLNEASQLFDQFPDLNLKIVYLSRDPRGTVNSRKRNAIKFWCGKDPKCSDEKLFCKILQEDQDVACKLLASRPEDFAVLRYEDLAREPHLYSKRLSKFLGFNGTSDMDYFIKSHTSNTLPSGKSIDGLNFYYTTFRNSVIASTKWRQELPFDQAVQVQNLCTKVLDGFGYHKYNTSGALRSNVNFDKDVYDSMSKYCPQDLTIF